jgi:amino acid permease
MNVLALAFLLGVLVVGGVLCASLDKRHAPPESSRHKFGRRVFYAFAVVEASSLLLVAFTLLVACYVYSMPLDWSRMHGFWKRGAPLLAPAVWSFLLAALGVPLALLAIAISFRLRRAFAAVVILALSYLVQLRFVHWLAD